MLSNALQDDGIYVGNEMPKKAKELSATEVRRLAKPGFHAVGGVDGLGLRINEGEGKSWILRTMVGGKRRDIGLGGFPDVTLAAAREAARSMKAAIRAGTDPLAERRKAKAELVLATAKAMTFGEAVEAYLASGKLDGLTNKKHRKQWESTVKTYAIPKLGNMPLNSIEPRHVQDALQPIWTSKNETASRLRGRIETVLTWAAVSGHASGPNPARWKGNLVELLPAVSAKSKHYPAVQVDQVSAWFAALDKCEGTGARALEFLTLTAARSGEVRGATWSEIDFEGGLWVIPAHRMKMKKEHRVPLSDAVKDFLKRLPRLFGCDYLFPSTSGGMISDMTVSAVMRRMQDIETKAGRPGWLDISSKEPAVPHGLRSTFRDWVAEKTDYPSDLAEVALAHKVGNAVEQAYRRSDMLEKRRLMMKDWAGFLTGQDRPN
jgi:integrase